MGSQQTTYLIIGCGIFGASTAYHLKKARPDCSVLLVDRSTVPCPSAASHDLNKIVRADYDDLFYMKLGLEAMEGWRSNDIFSPWYHESGILIADETGWGGNCLKNYDILKETSNAEMMPLGTAIKKFPMFAQAKFDGINQCYFNASSGWVEADKALSSCLDAAKEVGVELHHETIVKVLTDNDGHCTGAISAEGKELHADMVLLCTGAYTDRLLLDSFPMSQNLHVNGRLIATGAVSCSATFNKNDTSLLRGAPVLINTLSHTEGDSIPPLTDGRLKCHSGFSFTNNTLHKASGKTVSIPPSRESQSIWGQDVPQQLKDDVTKVLKHTYGDTLRDLKVEQFRMCWDSVTPDQDWIISPHSGVKNLYIASGGSFHSWKFLPIIGKYVTQMLLGEINEEMAQRWAWDRKPDGSACPMYIPKRDFSDLY